MSVRRQRVWYTNRVLPKEYNIKRHFPAKLHDTWYQTEQAILLWRPQGDNRFAAINIENSSWKTLVSQNRCTPNWLVKARLHVLLQKLLWDWKDSHPFTLGLPPKPLLQNTCTWHTEVQPGLSSLWLWPFLGLGPWSNTPAVPLPHNATWLLTVAAPTASG